MQATWALQDAKNRLSEGVNRARTDGTQTITRRGEEAGVVLSVDDFQALVKPEGDLLAFLQKSPLKGVELDLTRQTDYGREVNL